MSNPTTFLYWLKVIMWTIRAMLEIFNGGDGDINDAGESVASSVIRQVHEDLSDSVVNRVKASQVAKGTKKETKTVA